jgi:uncharacterized protein (TIGR02597 family)
MRPNIQSHFKFTLVVAVLALALSASVLAQSPLASDPVGIATTTLLGNSDSFISIPFTRSVEFIGGIQSISGNVITVMGAPAWTNNQFVYAAGTQPKNYYLLIGPSGTANPKEGHTYPVTGNGSNTLTVDIGHDNLTGIPVNTQLILIPYWTLATLFPVSDQNVSFTPTTSSSSYQTEILIPSYSTSGINLPYSSAYFFSNNVDGTTANVGWRVVGDNTTDHGDDPLLPDGYFVVRNANGAPTLPLINLGAMLMKKLAVPLMTATSGSQDNPVSIVRPLNVALDATGLSPGDGSFITNDQLLLFDNSLVAFDKAPSAIYYYNTAVGNTGGWRLSGDTSTDHGSDIIAAGTGLVIRKTATVGGQTAFWTNTLPVSALNAVSRKTHGTAGVFDLNLPLASSPGIESRQGQGANSDQHQIIIAFPTVVTFSSAAVTSGTASVSSTVGSGTAAITVNLAGVANAQWLTLTLANVSDGSNSNDIAIRMGFLLGDVNASGRVDGNDVSDVQLRTRESTDNTNFQYDVDANGRIDGNDVSITQAHTRTSIR